MCFACEPKDSLKGCPKGYPKGCPKGCPKGLFVSTILCFVIVIFLLLHVCLKLDREITEIELERIMSRCFSTNFYGVIACTEAPSTRYDDPVVYDWLFAVMYAIKSIAFPGRIATAPNESRARAAVSLTPWDNIS